MNIIMCEQEDSVVATSQDHYITGLSALNIPCEEEGTGDWHFRNHYFPNESGMPKQLLAGKDYLSTNEWLGNEGIYDCYPILKDWGVDVKPRKIFAANHYRAVVDMVFHHLKSGGNIKKTISLNDWLPEAPEKQSVYQLLDRLKPAFTREEWLMLDSWKRYTLPSG